MGRGNVLKVCLSIQWPLDWGITVMYWGITVMYWGITVMSWVITAMYWGITVMYWRITAMYCRITVMFELIKTGQSRQCQRWALGRPDPWPTGAAL